MSLIAPYVDGQLQTSTTSSQSLANNSSGKESVVSSDTFLKLLVAEMQNQDPLEPTSNTEWVSQYATFTQVEQIGEMRDSMDVMRANSLIGKEVVMKVTNETTGEVSYKRGNVDYIVMEEGEALLVIDEEKYSMKDLDSVASEAYFEAYDKYTEFTAKIEALPALNIIDKSYKNTVGELYELFNNLSDYEKDYINNYAASHVEAYNAYLKKMEQFGITFGEEEEEIKAATIDDVLNSFNEKMAALMDKLNSMSLENSKADEEVSENPVEEPEEVEGKPDVGEEAKTDDDAEAKTE